VAGWAGALHRRGKKPARAGGRWLTPVAAGLVRKIAKHGLRVLGDGNIDRALHVTAHYFTESAKEKITKAGGTCEVITL